MTPGTDNLYTPVICNRINSIRYIPTQTEIARIFILTLNFRMIQDVLKYRSHELESYEIRHEPHKFPLRTNLGDTLLNARHIKTLRIRFGSSTVFSCNTRFSFPTAPVKYYTYFII